MEKKLFTRAAIGAVSAALALSACGGSGTSDPASNTQAAGSPTGSAGSSVAVENIAFQPDSLTVPAGTEVTWTNMDGAVAHTVTSGEPGEDSVPGVSKGSKAKSDGLFDGELAEDGATFSFTFDKPGTYAYFCEVHPSMTAEVVVE